MQIAAPIAASFGPPIGAALIGWIGLRGLFMLDAFAALLAGLLVTFLMPPAVATGRASVLARAGQAAVFVWKRRAIRWNFAAWFFSQGARTIVDAYLPLGSPSSRPRSGSAIGLVLGVYGLLTTAATWLSGGSSTTGAGCGG